MHTSLLYYLHLLNAYLTAEILPLRPWMNEAALHTTKSHLIYVNPILQIIQFSLYDVLVLVLIKEDSQNLGDGSSYGGNQSVMRKFWHEMAAEHQQEKMSAHPGTWPSA